MKNRYISKVVRTLLQTLLFSGIVFFISCGSSAIPKYKTLGVTEEGGATIHYIEVEVPKLEEVSTKSMKALVKELIKKSDAQKMYETNTAYYFFDQSQDIKTHVDDTRQAKAYYWYLTKILMRGNEKTEINWK